MPRRKELKGIASGIASRFASRNNDVDGYWAMGILYKLAYERDGNQFVLNLMTNESSPPFKHAQKVAEPFFDFLQRQLLKKGFEEHQITKAIIELEFNVAPTKRQIIYKQTWGEPFVCRVSITDDLNKKHVYEERGWCGLHDPHKEHRSIRRFAL